MKLDKLWSGLMRIANGDYVLDGDLICDESLEVDLDDRYGDLVIEKAEEKDGD